MGDVSVNALGPNVVREVRAEERDAVRTHEVYETVPISDCMRATGKMPVAVRRIDIRNGDSANPESRSRLVANEINHDTMHDLLDATPPLGALEVLIGVVVAKRERVCQIEGG